MTRWRRYSASASLKNCCAVASVMLSGSDLRFSGSLAYAAVSAQPWLALAAFQLLSPQWPWPL